MEELKPGQKAPAFKAPDQNGKLLSLKDFSGKKVVLYFYPKDDTPACTKEACSFRDHYQQLLDSGYEIIGVSPDTEKSHLKFVAKYDLPFPLLSDPLHKILEAYGVWGLKKFMGRQYMGVIRTTFVINEKGKIERIIKEVDTAQAAAQILTED